MEPVRRTRGRRKPPARRCRCIRASRQAMNTCTRLAHSGARSWAGTSRRCKSVRGSPEMPPGR
eukprot:5023563-Pyramimonas_sp.AAC.1